MIQIQNKQIDLLKLARSQGFLQRIHGHQIRLFLIPEEPLSAERCQVLSSDVGVSQSLGFETEYEIMMLLDLFAAFGRDQVTELCGRVCRDGYGARKNLRLLLRELNDIEVKER